MEKFKLLILWGEMRYVHRWATAFERQATDIGRKGNGEEGRRMAFNAVKWERVGVGGQIQAEAGEDEWRRREVLRLKPVGGVGLGVWRKVLGVSGKELEV